MAGVSESVGDVAHGEKVALENVSTTYTACTRSLVAGLAPTALDTTWKRTLVHLRSSARIVRRRSVEM